MLKHFSIHTCLKHVARAAFPLQLLRYSLQMKLFFCQLSVITTSATKTMERTVDVTWRASAYFVLTKA